jgi:hypothetical protein
MRPKPIFCGMASILLAVTLAAAQQVNDVPYQQSPPPVQEPSPAALWREQMLPLLEDILEQREQLGLSPGQVQGIERLAIDFAREVIRRQAERQVALLDLTTMLEPDPSDPAKPLDLGQTEAKIQEIERIGGHLELARLRAIEAGKAQLNAEQRAKLGRLFAGDPPDSLSISLVAARSGGGGTSGHAGGGGSRPRGGSPGHHPGGSPGHHPGGSPGHHPGWHGQPPVHHPGFHPGVRGGVYVGTWPWYWWGYPGPVYTAPPPPPQSYWYYCPAYGAYYPDVLSCPEPWVLVPPG